jgi:putative copper resistance protein D
MVLLIFVFPFLITEAYLQKIGNFRFFRCAEIPLVLVSFISIMALPAGCTHLRYGFASNPLPPDAATLSAGKGLYEQHCASCHGAVGQGDGPDRAGLPVPPTNLVESQKRWSDGVFHIRMIATAKNGMPSFRDTLPKDERWAIISYIRSLDGQPAPQN